MLVCIILLLITSISSFLLPFFFGKKLGLKGTLLFIIIFTLINVCISIYLWINMLIINKIIYIDLYNWIKIELFNINIGILLDPLSSSMLVIITFISLCAHLYSFEYLKGDPHIVRFFALLSLFTFFMIWLVLSENVIQLFVGWEGVGICSYLLINFWFNRIQANKSSILAILANKIGDLTLLIASLQLQYLYKTVSFIIIQANSIYFSTINEINHYISDINIFYNNNIECINLNFIIHPLKLEIIAILLIIACIGKSAQFGFHFWLPEAMEGPTPVSSLIHAATMVTAGIFLLLRFSDFFNIISNSFSFILFIGSITLFFASTVGLTQVDIKKVVAYSTCSQLGYMFLSCGFHNYINSMYHLFIHAFFKALLFLTSGYIIHLLSNEQDLRKMGGLLKILPYSYILMVIGSYSLAGLPYLSGFYSKDPLIENIITFITTDFFFEINSLLSFILILVLVTVLVTLLYSTKSIIDIYFFSFKGYLLYIKNIHYSNYYIQIPLFLLCIAAIYSGYYFQESMVGLNSDFLSTSIYVSKSNIYYLFDDYYYFSDFVDNKEKENMIKRATSFYKYHRLRSFWIWVYYYLLEFYPPIFFYRFSLDRWTSAPYDFYFLYDSELVDLLSKKKSWVIENEENKIKFLFNLKDLELMYNNNVVVSEFFPYYRFFLLHVLLYTLFVCILFKIIYKDFFFLLFTTINWSIYYTLLKKYIYINRSVLTFVIIKSIMFSKNILLSLFDKGVIESIGPYNVSKKIKYFFYLISKKHSGFLYHYIGYIYIGLIFIIFFFLIFI